MQKGGKGLGAQGGKGRGGSGRKGKGGGKDKASLTEKELEELREREKKKVAEKIVTRRTTAKPIPRWVKGFRTPLGLRFGHIRPKELTKRSLHQAKAIKEAYVPQILGVDIKGWISSEGLSAQHLAQARAATKEWMDLRFLTDTRVIENIQHERGRKQVCKTNLWESGPCFEEFVGNAACTFPESFEDQVVVDLHLLDFDPNTFQTFKDIEDKRKCWMQWHGTNFYSLSTILACNFLSPSRSEKHGHESMLSQGIYSSHFFEASAHFATPTVFTLDMLPQGRGVGPSLPQTARGEGRPNPPPTAGGRGVGPSPPQTAGDWGDPTPLPTAWGWGSPSPPPTDASRGVGPSSQEKEVVARGAFVPVLAKPMLLLLVPGDASRGGAGIYHQLPAKWVQIDGNWEKFDTWQIDKLPEDYKINPLFGQKTEEFTYKKYYNVDPGAPTTTWRPNETFNARKIRDPEDRYLSYTNLSNWADQCVSNRSHILGVAFCYTGHAGHKKHCSADRRKNLYFGWKPELEAPYGRPLDDWETQFDFPADHPHYEAQRAKKKAMANSGSGAASSGLGGQS